MTPKPIFLFCLFLICSCHLAYSQQKKPQRKTEKDSLELYRNIENYSRKRGFTRFLYKLIFEPVTAKQKITKNSFQKINKKSYADTEGKIIRKIKITTLDPFGYSEIDSTKKPNRWSYKAGNAIHNKTNNFAIRNLLLIRRNKPLDSLLVLESERLIRSQRYVRSVRMDTKLTSPNSDSVDVYIRVLDAWSLIPDFSGSGSRITLDLNERNFLGTGHQFRNTYKKRFSDGENGYKSLYAIPNILNTYITTTISYEDDIDNNYSKILNVERPFFSPYARWAAGVYFDQQLRREIKIDSNDVETVEKYKYNTQDFWAGHAYQIFRGSSEKSRTTNLITSARLLNVDYKYRPASDSLHYYADEKFYLVGIGISSRQFTQDKYLFNYAVVEDIPSGIVYSITGGYQQKNNINRYYFGARFSYGKYFKFGYLSTNIEYGSFYKHGPQQSAIVYKLIYFTNLIEAPRWKFRQFIKPELVIGNQRLNVDTDRLTLNDDRGIQGFNSNNTYGTKKLLVTFQTQGYSPWMFWGFRMNPYLSMTFGMLGDAQNGLKNSRMYSQFGAGIIISNDYLVFGSFQFSFSYYPTIPGVGDNLLKTNAYKTSDFRLQDFAISKPLVVPYQ